MLWKLNTAEIEVAEQVDVLLWSCTYSELAKGLHIWINSLTNYAFLVLDVTSLVCSHFCTRGVGGVWLLFRKVLKLVEVTPVPLVPLNITSASPLWETFLSPLAVLFVSFILIHLNPYSLYSSIFYYPLCTNVSLSLFSLMLASSPTISVFMSLQLLNSYLYTHIFTWSNLLGL